eukprot:gene9211-12422_t
MELEPKVLVFRDVRLNQSYTTSLCVTNPSKTSVEFTLRTSSPKCTVTPNRVTLSSGQSIVITVRLFLKNHPLVNKDGKFNSESIHIKSTFFEQKVPVEIYDHRTENSERNNESKLVPVISLSHKSLQGEQYDQRLKNINDVIAKIESAHPGLKKIIDDRVELERDAFEDKSEKILRILKKKDDTIASLRQELQEVQMSSHRFNDSNNLTKQNDDSFARTSLNTINNQTEMQLQQLLENERRAHEGCKTELVDSKNMIEDLNKLIVQNNRKIMLLSNEKSASTVGSHEGLMKEFQILADKSREQEAQIEVLIAELTHLHEERHQISELQSDLIEEKHRYDSLKIAYDALIKGNKNYFAKMENVHNNESSSQADAGDDDKTSNNRPLRGELFELSAEGKIFTSTPFNFQKVGIANQDSIQDNNAMIDLLKERIYTDNVAIEELEAKLHDARNMGKDIHERCLMLEGSLHEEKLRHKLAEEKCGLLLLENRELLSKLEECNHDLSNARSKLSRNNGVSDGHEWWNYIWYEVKRQSNDKVLLRNIDAMPGDINFEPQTDSTATLHINKLQENLRGQAIEIASIRQESLGQKLTMKRELESVQEELDQAQREIIRLKTIHRNHKADKELKMSELQATIRTLSAKSDIHSQLAKARQDVESEKLTSFHLRAEIDSFRELLSDEQRKMHNCRNDIARLNGVIESMRVVKTITDIPGVPPHALIEMMSGRIVALQSELSQANSSLIESISQLNSLKRLKTNANSNAFFSNEPNDTNTENNDIRSSNNNLYTNQFERNRVTNNSKFSLDPLSINSLEVNADVTPQMILESVDVLSLSQRVQTQELTIAEYRNQIKAMQEKILIYEGNKIDFESTTEFETKIRTELENVKRREDMLKIQMEEFKSNLDQSQYKIGEYENLIADHKNEDRKQMQSRNLSVSNNDDHIVMNDEYVALNNSDISVTDIEDKANELDHIKSLLRERTAQLKVVMDTMDSLQIAGIRTAAAGDIFDQQIHARDNKNENNSNYFNTGESLSNLAGLANNPLPSVEGAWVTQALVKRIVELTTELTSQHAISAIEERKANELEMNLKLSLKEINQLKVSFKKDSEIHNNLMIEYNSISNQLSELEKDKIEYISKLKTDNLELNLVVKEAESKLCNALITIEELSKQIEVGISSEVHSWMDFINLENEKFLVISNEIFTKQVENVDKHLGRNSNIAFNADRDFRGKRIQESSLRELVVGVILDWIEHKNKLMNGKVINATNPDQEITQKIADLLLNVNKRVVDLENNTRKFELQAQSSELSSRINAERLKAALNHLSHYRQRCYAFERIAGSDSRISFQTYQKQLTLVTQHLQKADEHNERITELLRSEKKEKSLLEVKFAMKMKEWQKMRATIAEFESKGSNKLRARDNAIQALEQNLKLAEDRAYNWFKVELPRLLTGLPITEDVIGTYFDENFDPNYGLSSVGSSAHPITNQMINSMGLDRTYAIAQALCSSKASQAGLEMRIAGLNEKLSVMKDRNYELEGVLTRWKSDIDHRHNKSIISFNYSSIEDTDSIIQQINYYSDKEKRTGEELMRLNSRIKELEKLSLEQSSKLDYSSSRLQEMKNLVDTVLGDEQLLKTKALQQLNNLRNDLENHHVLELHNLRQSFEDEKRALIEEMDRVALAVEEAQRSAQPWQRMIRNTDDSMAENNSLQRKFDDENFDKPIHLSRIQTSVSNRYPNDSVDKMNVLDAFGSPEKVDSTTNTDSLELKAVLSTQRLTVINEITSKRISDDTPAVGKHDNYTSQARQNDLISKEIEDIQHTLQQERQQNAEARSMLVQQYEDIQRALDREKQKCSEAKAEVKELEKLLAIQHNAFKKQLDINQANEEKKKINSMLDDSSSESSTPNISKSLDEWINPKSSLLNHDNPMESHSAHISFKNVVAAVTKEDPSSWPPINKMAEALVRISQSLAKRRIDSSSYRKLIQAVILLAVRIERLSNNNQINSINETLKVSSPFMNSESETLPNRNFEGNNSSNNNMNQVLSSIINRVKMIESDFSDEKIAERHIYLVRDLRLRLLEFDRMMADEMISQQSRFAEERTSLIRIAQENAELLSKLKFGQDESITTIRQRYEDALKRVEETLETSTKAAQNEISRLEELLRQANQYNNQINQSYLGSRSPSRQQHDSSDLNYIQSQPRSRPVYNDLLHDNNRTNDKASQSETLFAKLQQQSDELNHTKQLLQQTNNELEININRNNSYNEELNFLKSNFIRFQKAQQEIVKSLENHIDDLKSQGGTVVGNNTSSSVLSSNSSTNLTLIEAEDKIRKLEYQYRVKAMELDAAMRSIAKFGNEEQSTAFTADSTIASEGEELLFNHGQQQQQINMKSNISRPLSRVVAMTSTPMSNITQNSHENRTNKRYNIDHNIPPDIRNDVFEARIIAAEQEIEALHQNLMKEKMINSNLKNEIQYNLYSFDRPYSQPATSSNQQSYHIDNQLLLPPHMSSHYPIPPPPPASHLANTSSLSSINTNNKRNILNYSDTFLKELEQDFIVPDQQIQDLEALRIKIKQIVKRANEMKMKAKDELIRLREFVLLLLHGPSNASKEDPTKLKNQLVECKNQIQVLREENMRKAKVLSSLKLAKSSDSNALEQWRNEAKQLEDNVKRLQRSLNNKDMLIKDLKAKVENNNNEENNNPDSSIGNNDIMSLSITELRT